MIDLHCHLLPGIDDGSKNMDISLRLAQEAVDNGVTHALLTPHHMNGAYINHKTDVLRMTEDFQAAITAAGIPLTVFPGQEVRINGDLLDALDNDDILFADADNQYMLLEFPDDDVPTYTTDMVYQLQMRGIIPIIVHPERNTKIMRHPEIILQLLEKGCLSQVTASSFVGTFGEKVETFSRQLIAAGQAYVFASDTHDLPGRKYEMRQAFDKLSKEFGQDVAAEFKANAKSIINGDRVAPHVLKPIQIKQKKKLFGLF
ncbi:exopolysaccharide biosynthesis protein [Paucilactobacillus oligofermentans DSM 15707 = LMG 22743]|uniref:Tyrosine-protein phosphatase n=1 Tax=Paucilactobacillus oligofermentans DSM 15707 = LMG 22743 TaxID=1423778 RepID=A0A0R1RME2_9LACO|nr:CpsB/CapC family capsule biosynthesis tyrosine phosphatase [Paucilactobacillus oligofermentans]KRL58054.1 exopolysaccharide biosynthesis protein [Paucilactobacillus oligofermentans DSM 15707 = LMG 22743]CUS26961.1 Tyrosine-protein phosphatase YwqE [Paucilactobacillus oligofermentans DSM 15707 = LMG 22743]